MKHLAILIALLACGTAATPTRGDAVAPRPFQVGEKLTYQIFWGPFVAGRATLEIRDIGPANGRDCYHLVATITTTGLAGMVFPVKSTFESWMDVKDLCVRRCVQNRAEGKRAHHTETIYDYDLKSAITTNFLNGKVRALPLDAASQDPISSFYYARSLPLTMNNAQSFPINTGDTNVVVTLTPDERKDFTLRPVGEVPALRIEPKPTLTIVSKNAGRMWFWVSDDKRKLPLVVVSNLKFGSIKMVLFTVEPASPRATKLARQSPATVLGAALPALP